MSDIFDDILGIAHNFKRAGLRPPEAIILESHEEGMRFLAAVRQQDFMIYTMPDDKVKPIEHPDGSVWMEVSLYAMKVRWPANRVAMESGGYIWA